MSRPVRWAKHPEYDEWLLGHTEGRTIKEVAQLFNAEFNEDASTNAVGLRGNSLGCKFSRGRRNLSSPGGWNKGGKAPWVHGYRGDDVPIGHERETTNGQILVKVAMRPTKPRSKDNWVPKERLTWETAHGTKLDLETRRLVFVDGDRRNYDPANIVDVDRRAFSVINNRKDAYPYHDEETLRLQEARALLRIATFQSKRKHFGGKAGKRARAVLKGLQGLGEVTE